MPPQQTSRTSGPDRGAAGLRFDFASTEDALSEKQAAGPPAGSTRGALRWLRGYWRAFRERRQRNKSRESLRGLSDRQLMDIGIPPGDIECIVAYRAFEGLRDGTSYPWLSRGVM
jgi:uncharacterized protein YjiS (DUF1127 family)